MSKGERRLLIQGFDMNRTLGQFSHPDTKVWVLLFQPSDSVGGTLLGVTDYLVDSVVRLRRCRRLFLPFPSTSYCLPVILLPLGWGELGALP